jgi:hypothetical protein
MLEQTGAASRLVSVSADRPQSRHGFVGSLDHDLQVYSMRSILSIFLWIRSARDLSMDAGKRDRPR